MRRYFLRGLGDFIPEKIYFLRMIVRPYLRGLGDLNSYEITYIWKQRIFESKTYVWKQHNFAKHQTQITLWLRKQHIFESKTGLGAWVQHLRLPRLPTLEINNFSTNQFFSIYNESLLTIQNPHDTSICNHTYKRRRYPSS